MIPTFKNGLYFNGGLADNLDKQKERIYKGKASLIIIDGIPGEGKTTLGIHLLEYYQSGVIDYNKQYAMGFADFSKKLGACVKEGMHVIIYDEAGDYNKRGWASAINRHLNRIFEVYRQFKILIIMIGPSFYKYDSDLILTGVPRLLIHCYGRTETYGKYKGYGLWRMTHIKKKMDNKQVACKHEVYNWTVPNFKGLFKDLPKDRAEKLRNISSLGKSNIFEEIEIEHKGYKDYRQLAEALGRTQNWVKLKVNELGIEPVKKFNRKKYFDASIINELKEYLGGSPEVET
jgi:hypothetical protein